MIKDEDLDVKISMNDEKTIVKIGELDIPIENTINKEVQEFIESNLNTPFGLTHLNGKDIRILDHPKSFDVSYNAPKFSSPTIDALTRELYERLPQIDEDKPAFSLRALGKIKDGKVVEKSKPFEISYISIKNALDMWASGIIPEYELDLFREKILDTNINLTTHIRPIGCEELTQSEMDKLLSDTVKELKEIVKNDTPSFYINYRYGFEQHGIYDHKEILANISDDMKEFSKYHNILDMYPEIMIKCDSDLYRIAGPMGISEYDDIKKVASKLLSIYSRISQEDRNLIIEFVDMQLSKKITNLWYAEHRDNPGSPKDIREKYNLEYSSFPDWYGEYVLYKLIYKKQKEYPKLKFDKTMLSDKLSDLILQMI